MSKTALLIEDNEQNRYLLTFLLEHHGYRVVSAEDGTGGIALASELKPDLILLDIRLPRMDGYAVAGALRSIEALRGVPIVAVTSYALTGDREKALGAGCSGYIEKPIDPASFAEQISKFAALPDCA